MDPIEQQEPTAPTIYLTLPSTGEFFGVSTADVDPLVPGNWLLPAGAYTDEPPPAQEGYARVRKESGWEQVRDLRGVEYWDAEGQKFEIQNLGETVPAGASLAEPPPSRMALESAVLAERDQRLLTTSARIQVLNYAVELAMATEAEAAELERLKRYSVLLGRINVQPGFPDSVEWPNLESL